MKLFLKVLIGVVTVLAAALVILRVTGLNPRGPRPGLWLSGTIVKTTVADWSFSDQHPMVQVQTQPWYFVPHSVTIFCASYENRLYLQALGKTWKGYVLHDPRVRIKIADRLYDGTAVPVTDQQEYWGVAQSMRKKYGGPLPTEFYPDVYLRFTSK